MRRRAESLLATAHFSSTACTLGLFELLHFLSEAKRPHVRPDSLNMVQALSLSARLARKAPSRWIFAGFRPERVLSLMIDKHFENCLIVVEYGHRFSPLGFQNLK